MSTDFHRCPKCGEFHDGDYAQCERCLAGPKDPDEEYDYADDDFNFDAAREGRFR